MNIKMILAALALSLSLAACAKKEAPAEAAMEQDTAAETTESVAGDTAEPAEMAPAEDAATEAPVTEAPATDAPPAQ